MKYRFQPMATKAQKETMFYVYTKMSYLFSLFYYKGFACYLKPNNNARFSRQKKAGDSNAESTVGI